ncbi:hypothetical protein BCR37DRAFT_406101 [Protomyces lactucae-debilis]|uniref:Uncharacterized protein n=1 Tax=Protomyces lactucae-debilis TaxID=2754530 RepID=A0A1Y2EYD8_PROLT|nr:uncharacterized protein BCR37DRAFT_406101 [Protomyces lactucae-debilis]ORY76619.1 hypothetical protein BCR37DRAFT_406101 [Protomyces lactucae-debilis]
MKVTSPYIFLHLEAARLKGDPAAVTTWQLVCLFGRNGERRQRPGLYRHVVDLQSVLKEEEDLCLPKESFQHWWKLRGKMVHGNSSDSIFPCNFTLQLQHMQGDARRYKCMQLRLNEKEITKVFESHGPKSLSQQMAFLLLRRKTFVRWHHISSSSKFCSVKQTLPFFPFALSPMNNIVNGSSIESGSSLALQVAQVRLCFTGRGWVVPLWLGSSTWGTIATAKLNHIWSPVNNF